MTSTILPEAFASHNQQFPPLELVTKSVLTTREAAFYLNRQPQTLRVWAMKQHPIRAINVYGRLGWRVNDIRNLVSGGSDNA